MDLGDVMRELGLDAIGASSASGASTQGGETAPTDVEEFDDVEEFETVDETDTGAERVVSMDEAAMPSNAPGEEIATAEAESGTENGATGMDDDRTDEILDRLDDISYEIDQLSTGVEENRSTIRTLRNEREGLRERMESIEENNATMLGIYDRLTNEINPFAADWDERYDQKVSEQDGPVYGVIEPPENEMEVRREIMEQRDDGGSDGDDEPSSSAPEPDADGAVSFDDLKHKHDDGDGTDEAQRSAASTGEPETGRTERNDPGAATDDPRTERTSSDPEVDGTGVDEPPIDPTAAGAPVEAPPQTADGPYLSALAPTVATEVLIMEWLTMLIDIAGPAGAMKALDFYERIGWIGADIKRQLEDVLSGAHERGDPPSRPPSDLTADEHNRSFAHIVRLAQQAQLARSREG